MSPKISEVINQQTDVLIIGGGGAGLKAAIAAREKGSEVLLVSKSRAGFGNNTAIARGAFAASGGWRDSRDNSTVHEEDTLRSGRFINNARLVQTLTRNSPQQVYDLEKFGVNFIKVEGMYRLGHVPGHTYP
ncbi:MAG: fumarate reductase/succinate dehydrogenase flavoprotein subunit, partial [Dehalococcoidia bacterium]|nr:fumarate reductase/succinate dehydrogenase flavoprotein subunit [Dehalococcoidia bacterium]